MSTPKESLSPVSVAFNDSNRIRDLQRKTLSRLLLVYWIPLILITGYFAFQYHTMQTKTHRLRMQTLAENQAHMLNFFLRERLTKLINTIDNPRFPIPPTSNDMALLLTDLQKNNETYIDAGFFDPSGVQIAYAGPLPSLLGKDYSRESWYQNLKTSPSNFVITDDYLGFRNRPHFTIAVSRTIEGQFYVLRATLDPIKIHESIASTFDAEFVQLAIVNATGQFQVVSPRLGTLLQPSSIVPPPAPVSGVESVSLNGHRQAYAYCWMKEANWASIVQWNEYQFILGCIRNNISNLAFAALFLIVIFLIIFRRARHISDIQWEQEKMQLQLQHASKLASVGELASGIAHEINNPLAIVCSETGLLKDLLNPQFGEKPTPEDMIQHLNNIREAAFRCRDITRHLLEFVRTTDPKIELYDLHTIINEVVERWMGRKMALANIEIRKRYENRILEIETDRNRLQQVLLNLFTNAKDAIHKNGWIEIETFLNGDRVFICISDNGQGMAPAELEKIFLPFYTTKEVGKGTGLGLSVSYNIIKKLGGQITVESQKGIGSTFTIVLPQTQSNVNFSQGAESHKG